MTTPYDDNNIFAKILRGELPSHKIYEDDKTIAIMDIMPRGDGHCLVIPKTASRNMLDIAPDDLNAVMATVQKMAHAVIRAFVADGVT
ncbi:MAG: HIT domain-containing protein, partial [Roseobacter sp.]